jgi:hypothetical protein
LLENVKDAVKLAAVAAAGDDPEHAPARGEPGNGESLVRDASGSAPGRNETLNLRSRTEHKGILNGEIGANLNIFAKHGMQSAG